jgi:signal transduction histidine kinase
LPTADDAPDRFASDAFDQLRHDLKTPLTTISARAQLLGRSIRRSPALAAEERAQMLAAIITIERTVWEMVAVVDGIGDAGHGGRNNPG